MNLGNLVKENRTKKGYSQKKLADLVGVSKSYINKIEYGVSKKPNLLILKKLSIILELDFYKLVDLTLSKKELKLYNEFLGGVL